MTKYRKMLSDASAPYIQSLMRAIETQSKATIARWCVGYCGKRLLPAYENQNPTDMRPRKALAAAMSFIGGTVKLNEAKLLIKDCREAAREAEGNPVSQGLARAIDASASSIHNPPASLGLALYGSLALAYLELGVEEQWEKLEKHCAKECAKMEAALRKIGVMNEPNPAKISWKC
jgi:hypothetical protein